MQIGGNGTPRTILAQNLSTTLRHSSCLSGNRLSLH